MGNLPPGFPMCGKELCPRLTVFLFSPCLITNAPAPAGTFLFSVASPVAAVATYVFLIVLGVQSYPSGPALCLLYSGGTFVHAACVHILPEVLDKCSGSVGSFVAVVLGSMVPATLQFLDIHEHVEAATSNGST